MRNDIRTPGASSAVSHFALVIGLTTFAIAITAMVFAGINYSDIKTLQQNEGSGVNNKISTIQDELNSLNISIGNILDNLNFTIDANITNQIRILLEQLNVTIVGLENSIANVTILLNDTHIYAIEAGESAFSANGSAYDANGSANSANISAYEALTAANEANISANEANTYAHNANTSANDASISANDASISAYNASVSTSQCYIYSNQAYNYSIETEEYYNLVVTLTNYSQQYSNNSEYYSDRSYNYSTLAYADSQICTIQANYSQVSASESQTSAELSATYANDSREYYLESMQYANNSLEYYLRSISTYNQSVILLDQMEQISINFNSTVEYIINSGLLNGNLSNATYTLLTDGINAANESIQYLQQTYNYYLQVQMIWDYIKNNESQVYDYLLQVEALAAQVQSNASLVQENLQQVILLASYAQDNATLAYQYYLDAMSYANFSQFYMLEAEQYYQEVYNISQLLGLQTNGTIIFNGVKIGGGKITFIQSHDTTIQAEIPGQDITVFIPDPGTSNSSFVLTEGDQTINGAKTFTEAIGSSTLPQYAVLTSTGTKTIEGLQMMAGELLIGANSSVPAVGNIMGTTNQVTVINGQNTIQISLPQNIDTGAIPEFYNLQLSGISSSDTSGTLLYLASNGTLVTMPLTDGTFPFYHNSYLYITDLVGSTDEVTVDVVYNTTDTSKTATIVLGLPQPIATTNSPTFLGLDLEDMTNGGATLTMNGSNANIDILQGTITAYFVSTDRFGVGDTFVDNNWVYISTTNAFFFNTVQIDYGDLYVTGISSFQNTSTFEYNVTMQESLIIGTDITLGNGKIIVPDLSVSDNFYMGNTNAYITNNASEIIVGGGMVIGRSITDKLVVKSELSASDINSLTGAIGTLTLGSLIFDSGICVQSLQQYCYGNGVSLTVTGVTGVSSVSVRYQILGNFATLWVPDFSGTCVPGSLPQITLVSPLTTTISDALHLSIIAYYNSNYIPANGQIFNNVIFIQYVESINAANAAYTFLPATSVAAVSCGASAFTMTYPLT